MAKSRIAAVVDIGSSSLQMKISERRKNEKIDLEYLEYPLTLGHETFTKGKINFEKVDKICEILKGFFKLTEEYGIDNIKVVATTAVREASNRQHILDQISVRTKQKVTLLDDAEEKLFIYNEAIRRLYEYGDLLEKNILMSYIGTGSIGVSVYEQGKMSVAQNMRMGSLKLSEMLGQVQEQTEKFYIIVEEYLNTLTEPLINFLPKKPLDYFLATGKEINVIAQLCKTDNPEDCLYITKKALENLYEKIKLKTPEQLTTIYNISNENAEILLPSLTIYKVLMEFTNAKEIIAPPIKLTDAIMYGMLFPRETLSWGKIFEDYTISSAKHMAKRYKYDKVHAEVVAEYSLKIFDRIKRFHGLGSRERILLHVASILHDIGKYVNVKKHYEHSYNLIISSDILGLSSKEMRIIANVARYHSKHVPSHSHDNYKSLTSDEKVLISKLAAILRLGDALDRSHNQKFDNVEVNMKKNSLIIKVTTYKNSMLEEWTFNHKADFFTEVYGIKTEFIRKRVD